MLLEYQFQSYSSTGALLHVALEQMESVLLPLSLMICRGRRIRNKRLTSKRRTGGDVC